LGRIERWEGGQSEVSAAVCRNELDRILASAEFDTTDRGRRFLRYVVEESLAGRGDRIKAYSVAVEVFGRDASFDPQSDPIVRIEAGHLRRALERYYLTGGVDDPIRITIPKGGYVPVFMPGRPEAQQPANQPAATPAEDGAPHAPAPAEPAGATPGRLEWRRPMIAAALLFALLAVGSAAWRAWPGAEPTAPERPRLLVQPFEDLSGTQASAAIASGLSQEIIGQLSKFKDIAVYESVGTAMDEAAHSPRFSLGGSVDLSPEAFRLRVRLTNRADGAVLWAESYDGEMKVGDIVRAQSEIARNVATTLAQAYGVISKADASIRADNPPEDWAAYACTLSFYAYRAEVDMSLLPGVRDCLERAVARFPDYATAWGLLSQAYIDQMRFSFPFDPRTSPKTIDRALAAAQRAVELDPLNVRALEAEMTARYFARDAEGALEAGKRAMEINPNDIELMKEYGSWLAQSGNWAEGCQLTEEAVARNPARIAYSEAALAMCAYFGGRYEVAATLIKRTPAVNNPAYHALAAAFLAEAGHRNDADRERIWLEENAPGLVKNIRQELSLRFLRKQDVDFFIGSLKKAGLQVGD